MACWSLPDGCVSLRQVSLRYGFNQKHVRFLIGVGALATWNGRGIFKCGLSTLVEGKHYVRCAACSSWAGQISDKHLRLCCGLSVNEYVAKYPDAPMMCSLVAQNRAKTDEQRVAQSEKLKRRFKTPAGEVTRRQIGRMAKRQMESGYREQATEHLRKLNRSPERRAEVARASSARWADGSMRKIVSRWHRENKELSLRSAHNARKHIRRTFTKPHAKLEHALLEVGVPVEREFSIGYYHVDEALVDEKIAIEVDGCYWHGCTDCGYLAQPWNRALDRRRTTYLKKLGWEIVRIRECEIKADLKACVSRVVASRIGRRAHG